MKKPPALVWCPYRAAEQHDDLDIQHDELPPSTGGGLYIRWGDRTATIVVDPRLEGPARRNGLTHELVHHERGGGAHGRGVAWCWPERSREERRVRAITAERLVPTDDLQRFCDLQADLGHGVGPDDIAREFEATWQVACDALNNLTRYERGSI